MDNSLSQRQEMTTGWGARMVCMKNGRQRYTVCPKSIGRLAGASPGEAKGTLAPPPQKKKKKFQTTSAKSRKKCSKKVCQI